MALYFASIVAIILFVRQPLLAQDDTLIAKSKAAHQALLAGQYDKAVRLYRDLVAALPENPGLRLNLGLALEKAGQPAAAIPQLKRAAHAQPELAGPWFLLGLAYQQLKQPQQAIAPLREAVRLDSSNQHALFELADAELASDDSPGAARDFQRLTETRPDMAKAWQGAGLAYHRWGEQLALRLQQPPLSQSGYAKALAARTQADQQHFGAALSLYRQALQLIPSIQGIHEACARIYRQTDHADWAAVEEERERQLPVSGCTSQIIACAYRKADYQTVMASHEKNAETFYWQALAARRLSEISYTTLAHLPPSAAQHEVLAEAYQQRGGKIESRRRVASRTGAGSQRSSIARTARGFFVPRQDISGSGTTPDFTGRDRTRKRRVAVSSRQRSAAGGALSRGHPLS